ncbi:hypothetical protein N9L76_10405 [bacterium]|nr:hypothetical protein [bacterium]
MHAVAMRVVAPAAATRTAGNDAHGRWVTRQNAGACLRFYRC